MSTEQATFDSASARLTVLTAIVIIGILFIYIYHEFLKPSYDRALAKYERIHKVTNVYRRKKSDGEEIQQYDTNDLKKALNRVKKILEEELILQPNDTVLQVALSDIEDDLLLVVDDTQSK